MTMDSRQNWTRQLSHVLCHVHFLFVFNTLPANPKCRMPCMHQVGEQKNASLAQ
jgi:hypothetical protein